MDGKWHELARTARDVLAQVAARRKTITYEQLVARLGAELPSDPGRGLSALLRLISTEEDSAGRGMLTAVVTRGSGLPAAGFFRLAEELGRDPSDRAGFWREELERVYQAHHA